MTPAWTRWRWFPNFHFLCDLVGQQTLDWGNPRDIWAYMDEGAIGMAVDVAESVHIATFASAIINKYLVWFQVDD